MVLALGHVQHHCVGLLHWLPTCFQVQFKVLIVTFKALHELGPGYLMYHLLPVSICPIWSGSMGMLWVPSAKEYQLVETRRCSFSAIIPSGTSYLLRLGWSQPCWSFEDLENLAMLPVFCPSCMRGHILWRC